MEIWIDPHNERNQQRIVWEEDPFFITEKVWQEIDSMTGELVIGRCFYIRSRFRRNRIGKGCRSIEEALAYLIRNDWLDDPNADFEKCGLRRPRPRKRQGEK